MVHLSILSVYIHNAILTLLLYSGGIVILKENRPFFQYPSSGLITTLNTRRSFGLSNSTEHVPTKRDQYYKNG